MDTKWIEEVLRLNTRVVAAEMSIRNQADRILEMTEARRDTSGAEGWFMATRKNLCLLREMRDALLNDLEAEG